MLVCGTEAVRLKRIEEASLPPELPAPIPPGLSTVSSISAAPSIDRLYAAVSGAFLPIHQPHYMYGILKLQQEMSRIVEKEGKLLDRETRNDLEHIQTLNNEKIEKLQLHAKELQSKVKWSAWQTVAQYVTATTSIVLGLGCAATPAGAVAGAFLIASGALGLANRVASDSGIWQCLVGLFTAQRELQIKIANRIDQGLSAVSLALSIGGTIGAYNARALEILSLGRDPIMQKAALALTSLNSVLNITMQAGAGVAGRRQHNFLADLKMIDLTGNVLREEVKTNTAEVNKMIQLSDEIDKIIKGAISSLT